MKKSVTSKETLKKGMCPEVHETVNAVTNKELRVKDQQQQVNQLLSETV